jgi:hypothetical protein
VVVLPATTMAREDGIEGVIREALGPVIRERDELRRRLTAAEADRDRWRRRVDKLEEQLDALKLELEEARRAAKRQAAPFGRRKRKKDPKPPGRPAGHPAATRPAPAKVDEEVYVPLTCCPRCHGAVQNVRDLAPQVVIDVEPPPDVGVRVRRFHNQSGYCVRCRRQVQSRDAGQCSQARGSAGVQIGPQLHSLAVDLHYRVGVTFRKVSGIFALIFGLTFSAAAWARAGRRIGRKLRPTYLSLVAAARQSDVTNLDETGWYITEAGSKKPWLHVVAAPELGITLFAIRLSRGGEVALELLGAGYQGQSGVDGWAAYIQLPWRKGQCHAHLLRRCAELREVQKAGAARFPLAVERLLLAGKEIKGLLPALPPEDGAALIEQVKGELHVLLAGDIEEPANLRFANHLRRHEREIFTFLDVPAMPATNNEAEREIRPAVVTRKVSAGNRTLAGAHAHEVIASVSRSAERNGILLPTVLPVLLRSPASDAILPVLAGRPMPPPVESLPYWKEVDDRAAARTSGRHVRRESGRLAREARTEARPPPT